jgi:purine-nucleoside phosphorylase
MVQNRRPTRMNESLTIQDHDIEVVKGFKCLGTVISNNDDKILEIKTTVLASNNTYSSPKTIFKSKKICQNNKIRLYKRLIKTVLCYGSVTWILTQMTEQKLCTFERKILVEFTAEYKIKNSSVPYGIVIFRIYTKI